MARLIDADKLMEIIEDNSYPVSQKNNSIEKGMTLTGIRQCIEEQPSVDAKPVRYAKRIVVRNAEPDRYGFYGYHPECSECGDTEAYGNYCSNCGAKFIGNNFVDEEKQNNISRGDKDAATD